MAFDVREIDCALEKLRAELETLLYFERTRPPMGNFVAATATLDAIKETPGNFLKLHPADLKGMHHFKTREHAEEIARFWNDDVAKRGPEHQHLRVTVMTKREHLIALIPHHREVIVGLERVRRGLAARETSVEG